MIIFSVVFGFLALVADVVLLCTPFIKERPLRKKITFAVSLMGIVVLFIPSLFNNVVRPPSINREDNHSAITLYTDEPMATIEYKISTDKDGGKWIEYKEPFKLDHGAIIYARTRVLWYTSEETDREVYVTENGLVYFSVIEIPKESINSIKATYNYKEPVINKSGGNHYVGYEIKKDDIKVIGKTLEGKDKEITDFTYSPKILKEGSNTIEIEYFITDKNSVKTNLYINGDSPKMIKLKGKYIEDVLYSGTTLDSNDFSVKGEYEDGTIKEITGYSISPTEIKKGNNKITLVKDGLSNIIELKAVDRWSITEKESEANNNIVTANEIDVNIRYTGVINEDGDVDYYKFDLDKKGKISIKLTHSKLDKDETFWKASLLSQEENSIVDLDSTGKNVETTSSSARVSPGTYYVKVSNEDYSNEEYIVTILFEEENDSYESEVNDDLNSQAMEIQLNKKYTGNLTTRNDVDYFKFSINEKRKVWLDFSHQKTSETNRLWRISLFGDSDGVLIDMSSTGEDAKISSDCVRLPAGNYYLRINNDFLFDCSWTDLDYTFCINSEEEIFNSENEDNGDYELATKIDFGASVIGNLQSENDVDFYKFEIKNTKSVKITFTHKLIDDNDTFWTFQLFSTEDSNALKNDEDSRVIEIKGNSSKNISSQWNSLSKGTYYIKVIVSISSFDSSYSNDDYTITLSN